MCKIFVQIEQNLIPEILKTSLVSDMVFMMLGQDKILRLAKKHPEKAFI